MQITKIISNIAKSAIKECKTSRTSEFQPQKLQNSIFDKGIDFEKIANFNSIKISDSMKAKFKCIDALNSPNPVERVILIDKATGKIAHERTGDAQNCAVMFSNFAPCKGKTFILHHGHPAIDSKGTSLPVSLQDFLVMNDASGLEQVIAYNKAGQQSYLKKKVNFEKLNHSQIEELKAAYTQAILNGENKDTTKINELMQYVKSHPEARGVKAEIAERLNSLQLRSSMKDNIDNFWRENASKVNMTYYSEF